MTEVLTATACTGAAVGFWTWRARRPDDAALGLLEARRRAALAGRSFVYREFGRTVRSWEPAARMWLGSRREPFLGQLRAAGERDWLPEEYVAAKWIGLVPGLFVGFVLLTAFSGLELSLPAMAALVGAAPLLVHLGLRSRVRKRLASIRDRLPFTLDLMALVLEAGGGTMRHCLQIAVVENRDHPLGEELGQILHGIEQGQGVAAAFGDFAGRLGDSQVREICGTIQSSETRGVPIRDCLRAVAARLRVMQIQWVEKTSEEAKVHITWPTMLVMGACLLIVVAPLVLGLMS